MEKKVTKRDNYQEIINILAQVEDSEALIEFCEKEIAALDKKALKAKENAAKKKFEADPLEEAVKDALDEENFQSIADITEKLDMADVTIHKVTYRLGSLVKEGYAERADITIPGGEGQKSRKIKGYRKAVEPVKAAED